MNGSFVAWKEATIHLMSHSVARGSAIFEVLGFHDTAMGRAVFRLDDHINRLMRTAQLLDMELPLSREALSMAVRNTVRRNEISQGLIKIVCFYPQIAFEVVPPQRVLDVAIFVLDSETQESGSGLSVTGGARVCISRWRKLDPETVPVQAKVAANYLNGMVAREDAKKRGFDFSIMLDRDGYIAEGATESVFLVQEGVLLTPALGTVLNGITRRSLLEAAEATGISTREGQFPSDLLFSVEEIFLSGTPQKLIPVEYLEERRMEHVSEPLTDRLASLMDGILTGRDERFRRWLFPID